MRAIFLSDAHIQSHNDPNLPPLLAFLEHVAGTVDRLIIVGDLFHTWFGFSHAVFDEYVPLLAALHAVKRAGTDITYITGNHDYEMGGYFHRILEAEVYDTQTVIDADGHKAFVAHGDLANPHDRAYRLLRFVLHARPGRWLGRQLPPSWIWHIGQWLAHKYSGNHPRTTQVNPVFQSYARQKFAEGYSSVILAHSHLPEFVEVEGKDCNHKHVNLGDWLFWHTFLRWDEGVLSLRQWSWPEAEEQAFTPPEEETSG